jgi:hypothetical protein
MENENGLAGRSTPSSGPRFDFGDAQARIEYWPALFVNHKRIAIEFRERRNVWRNTTSPSRRANVGNGSGMGLSLCLIRNGIGHRVVSWISATFVPVAIGKFIERFAVHGSSIAETSPISARNFSDARCKWVNRTKLGVNAGNLTRHRRCPKLTRTAVRLAELDCFK